MCHEYFLYQWSDISNSDYRVLLQLKRSWSPHNPAANRFSQMSRVKILSLNSVTI